MQSFRNLARGVARSACLAVAAVGLAGCYDVEATLNFRDDGSAAVTSRFDFPRDAIHVAKLYQAMLELQPGMARFFEDGLCQSVEKFAALVPSAQIIIQGREYTTDKRFGCGFIVDAGESAQFIDGLASMPRQTANVLRIEHLAPRLARITLDFNNVPDLRELMPGLVMLGALKYGKPGQPLPSMAAVAKLTEAYGQAALAMARMSAPDNHIQIAVKARRVIETNGEKQGDLVRFRWSWEEFTRLMLKQPQAEEGAPPPNKVFFAVIEY
jgi:hypothetical protein